MKKLTALAVLGAVLLSASPVHAETASVKNGDSVSVWANTARIRGSVTAVSTSSIVVAAENSSWTVDLNANIIANGGGRINADEIKVGDKVFVVGRLTSNSTIDASLVKDLSLSARKRTLWGIISDLNAELRSFTLTTRKGEEVKVTVDADAEVEVKNASTNDEAAATSSLAGLANGMIVKVKGMLSTSGTGTSTVKSIAASDVKAFANATSAATSSIRADWRERWEDWMEKWDKNHDIERNDNDKDDDAHDQVRARVDARIDGDLSADRHGLRLWVK